MPKISVIIPVFNASEFLVEALDSISNQTFSDFEIIAINDGSTDNSLEILNLYAKKEPRLCIVNQQNMGITKTLNEGIELSKGEYIARMDADDISLPQRFEKQMKFLEDNNLDICGTQYMAFGNKSGISNMPIRCEDCYSRLLLGFTMAHPSFLMKKSVIKYFKYNENFKYSQDYELCCRLALANVRMGNTPDVLLKYRFSNNQITSVKNSIQTSLAQSIGKYYWQRSKYTKDIQYPVCSIDIMNNKVNDLIDSINSLTRLFNRFASSDYMKNYTTSKQLILLSRLSVYGINTILPVLKQIPNLSFKSKILYSFIALTRIMVIKKQLIKILPVALKDKIQTLLYTK